MHNKYGVLVECGVGVAFPIRPHQVTYEVVASLSQAMNV